MKKYFTVLTLAFCLCFAMVGCSSGSSDTNASSSDANQKETTSTTEAAEPEEDTTAESDYVVTIDKSDAVKDYNGKKALAVTYTFTNNSEEAASFSFAIFAKAFQNGVELETAIVTDLDDSSAGMKEIKPGATVTVQEAYLLTDKSDVTVECEELISFDDVILAEKVFKVS